MSKYLVLLFLITYSQLSFCQYSEIHQITFNSRIKNPIKVEVIDNNGVETFNAENNSWFPYQIEIKFEGLDNLSPPMSSYKDVVLPGKRTLLRLKVRDPKSPHGVSYSFKYRIGNPHEIADTAFEYLYPLCEGKTINLFEFDNGKNILFYRNILKLSGGDTVTCMRKGIVTSTINSGDSYDRINDKSTIEILHEDGTVATYVFPGQSKILVEPGKKVYPLQPLFAVLDSGNLSLFLYDLGNETHLLPIRIKYEGDSEGAGLVNGSEVIHFMKNIESELSSKERKKYEKKELFKE